MSEPQEGDRAGEVLYDAEVVLRIVSIQVEELSPPGDWQFGGGKPINPTTI